MNLHTSHLTIDPSPRLAKQEAIFASYSFQGHHDSGVRFLLGFKYNGASPALKEKLTTSLSLLSPCCKTPIHCFLPFKKTCDGCRKTLTEVSHTPTHALWWQYGNGTLSPKELLAESWPAWSKLYGQDVLTAFGQRYELEEELPSLAILLTRNLSFGPLVKNCIELLQQCG